MVAPLSFVKEWLSLGPNIFGQSPYFFQNYVRPFPYYPTKLAQKFSQVSLAPKTLPNATMTTTDDTAAAGLSNAFDNTLAFAEEQLTECSKIVIELGEKAHTALRNMSVERATFQAIDAAYLLTACTLHFNDPEFLAARNADAQAFSNAHTATIAFNTAHDALLAAISQRRNWQIIVNTMRTGQLVRLNMNIGVTSQVLDSLPEEDNDDNQETDPDDETYNPDEQEERPLMSDEETDDCDSFFHD